MTNIATPKQTAGGGFLFEDKVVGYYLVNMLAGTPPQFEDTAIIDRLDCQVAADGWNGFDDLLITVNSGSQPHHFAFSIKSNIQFTNKSAPVALVRAAWEHLLQLGPINIMDVTNDMLGLICVPHPNPPQIAIQSLLRKAKEQTPRQLADRLPVEGYTSDVERNIHQSCACPDDMAKNIEKNKVLPGCLLKKLHIIEFDFENVDSFSKAQALLICKYLINNSTNINAIHLWDFICVIAQRIRTAGGGITREELLAEVRGCIELRNLPDFSDDWQRLKQWRDTQLSPIPDKVGGAVSIVRDDLISQVLLTIQNAALTGLIGASGTGKTVIAKQVAEEFQKTGHILWLKGEQIKSGYFEEFGSHHHLSHSLKEILMSGNLKRGLVIVDSSERLIEETDFAELCILLHMLDFQQPRCLWSLLFTCREEAWDRVHNCFNQTFSSSISWSPVRIDYPKLSELTPIWDAFPDLRTLAARPHLSQIMRNLKVLDLLASAIMRISKVDGGTWNGESDLIHWYWEYVVRHGTKGAQRAVLLEKLSEENADTGRFVTTEAELSGDELTLIAESTDLFKTDTEQGVVLFTHDLIADWAKFMILVSHKHVIKEYCKNRFTNPRWHTAFRLYGVRLLELDSTGKIWRGAITDIPEARGLFLESLVFAGNSKGLIESTWQILIADEGLLLNEFLKRFQYVATIPNPNLMILAPLVGTEEAKTWERLPLWIYWISVLSVLPQHADDLLRLTPTETARIARAWLRYTPQNWPGRQDAATLAIAVVKHVICGYYSDSNDDAQLPYKALLEAYRDKKDEVSELLLKASARKIPTEKDGEIFKEYEAPGKITHERHILGGIRTTQVPWNDGPHYRIRQAFRDACLQTDSLLLIMTDSPSLAREIILALLIERRPPKMEPDYNRNNIFFQESLCGLEHFPSFHPSLYIRGPFLLFLKTNPQPAVETIIKLIDFATERFMEHSYSEEARQIGIDIQIGENVKRFIGDSQIYHWYHGVIAPDIAISSLMALEKWFYECLDKNESVDKWINLILKTSQSAAFLGLLTEVGRYSPKLFEGILSPLILIPETYYYEFDYEIKNIHSLTMAGAILEGKTFYRMAHEWNNLKHRKLNIFKLVFLLFQNQQAIREIIITACKTWSNRIDEKDDNWQKYVQYLIAVFNGKNWQNIEKPDGTTVYVFNLPDNLQTQPDAIYKHSMEQLIFNLPMRCREILTKKIPLKVEEITQVIEKCKELITYKTDDPQIIQLSPPINGVLGIIAILFLLNREWLRENQEYEKWCLGILDQTLNHPPASSEFDFPESIVDYNWEHFACEIVPVIWAENPNNKICRERIIKLIFAKHYNTAGILLFNTFNKRKYLGKGFWQLTRICLDWATIRYQLRENQTADKKKQIDTWIKKATNKFATGKYASDMPSWGVESIKNGKLWGGNNTPQHYLKNDIRPLYKLPAIDMQQLQGTFLSVFLPSQATGKNERERFLSFWDQALLVCLAQTQFFDENGNNLDSEQIEVNIPYECESWILERIVLVIVQMLPEEKPERYWKPILSLGPRANHWIEHFLVHWFIDAKNEATELNFLREWKRMLDFCLSPVGWSNDNFYFTQNFANLWMSLIGIPTYNTNLWQENDAAILNKMSDYFIKISSNVIIFSYEAERFIYWLTNITAKDMRLKMLDSLSNIGLTASDHWWKKQNLPKTISRYLDLLWREEGAVIKSDPEKHKMFFDLLHRAAQTQEPLAIQLQKTIATP